MSQIYGRDDDRPDEPVESGRGGRRSGRSVGTDGDGHQPRQDRAIQGRRWQPLLNDFLGRAQLANPMSLAPQSNPRALMAVFVKATEIGYTDDDLAAMIAEFFKPCEPETRNRRYDPDYEAVAWRQFIWKSNAVAKYLRLGGERAATVRAPERTSEEIAAGYFEWKKYGMPRDRGRQQKGEHDDD